MAKEIKAAEFDGQVLKNNKVVLVDFFATWCMPCRMLAPILEQVSAKLTTADVVKIDIDQNIELAREYGIMSIPTMVVFKDGKEVERMVGMRQPNQIEETLNKYV